MNFRGFGDNPTTVDGMGAKPPATSANLVRQSSIYSLTFDEFQNTMGGSGKDFGSMNMDELLKNIWTAEETQAVAVSSAGGGGGSGSDHNNAGGGLQRQGSLTLPRTLSQKTVDEVWKDLFKDNVGGGSGAKDYGSGGNGVSSSMPHQTQRQPTLGEITLEEFLVRAGVVREDVPQQIATRSNANNEWFGGGGDFARPNNNNNGILLGFQQPNNNRSNGNLGNNLVPKHPPPLSLNSNHSQQQQVQQQQPPLFPKPANVAFANPMHMLNNAQLSSPGARGGMIGVPEHSMNGTVAHSSALAGMVGLAPANVTGSRASPANKMSPDVVAKGNVDTSSRSPVPYVINRGRKYSAIEKVVERRQRRMIKNRESAARSRARKQAYTFELEAEVQKLKEINQELQRKQAEMMEMQKSQNMDSSLVGKRQCLRRTLTGPW